MSLLPLLFAQAQPAPAKVIVLEPARIPGTVHEPELEILAVPVSVREITDRSASEDLSKPEPPATLPRG